MNAWPEDLWANERSLTSSTPALSVSVVDEETGDFLSITESIVPWAVLGMSLILFSSAAMVLAAATVGLSRTRTRLRLKVIGSDPKVRHTS